MNTSYPYLLCLFALCFLCGCYKSAEDSFIDDGNTTNTVNDTTEYDRQSIIQNRWTYAQMEENYLWEEYMPDSISLQFTDGPTDFFAKLKYKGDRFSWIERNADYRSSSLYDRFGVETADFFLPSGGKVYRTALVAPHSPAEAAGLRRGDWFKITASNDNRTEIEIGTIDGTVFRPKKKSVLLADEKDYTDAVSLDTIYYLQNRKIGYLVYNSFQDGMDGLLYPYRTELKNIFGNFKDQGITDLIIDLRYNPGGYLSICEIMCSLILPDEYLGEISGYFSYNKKLAAKLLRETGNEEEIRYFPAKNVIGENNVGLRKAYFIITGRTASASESLINSLAPCISVVTVGSVSTGKNVGSYTLKDDRYEWQLQPITFYYYNREHKAVPETGIVPDIPVNENNVGIWYDLGDTRELLLSVTLEQITGNSSLRSAEDYGRVFLKSAEDEERQHRKVEGLINGENR
ncbi:MAG: S41 family peptidase [Candidatus Azobacteroides sp.]|nr:S41 family peptidase [Candidatus Azobacteroides sp.]